MNNGIDIEQVKAYNNSLKSYQDKASQVRAAIEYNTKELNRLCSELSTELGITVTPENVLQIREERVEKIRNTLKVGNEILSRIQSEEAIANSPQPIRPTQVTQSAPVTPVAPAAQFNQQPPNLFNDLGNIPSIFATQQG